MNKKDLIGDLEEIDSEMENFLLDSSMLTAVKAFKIIQDKVEILLSKIEDEGIED